MSERTELIEEISNLDERIARLEREARDPESWERAEEIDDEIQILSDTRRRLQNALDDLEGYEAMREAVRDRAWAQWITR